MAKGKKVDSPQGIKNVEQTLTKTEQFLEENYKPLLIGLGILVVIVGIFWLGRMYVIKQNDEAQAQMYQAQRYLELDSLNLALNGDGNYLGFIDIAKEYRFTRAGNLARYGAGICNLHLGNYEEAIDYLEKYSKKDKVIGSIAIGATGDALVELGQIEKGISKYIEAAEYADNSFNTPLYLMKAGELYESSGKYPDALKVYERIKKEYPTSTEGSSIDKYIARVKILSKQ
ncbi:MAG TPA: tetratricopeptide repeat protein [Bacteroidales bacterium]|jgi:tetratricopeptide (TPR) repeat protein|nr:tetratricopeptide repeat protein [Bacteroidales bacterium]HOG56776.1 tetratricopeptide repeat protein [Bacteroidales bacterium]HPV16426.1 tetratricopeptide repeat protein [Bacteroidales bacterium]HQB85385.1 tetratricopeptide repeat protein [Bacteroidales bacterium]